MTRIGRGRRRARSLIVSLAGIITWTQLLLACSISDEPDSSDSASGESARVEGEDNANSGSKVESEQALRDGVVTLEEYNRHFALFSKCVTEVGGSVFEDTVDPTTGRIGYSIEIELGPQIDADTESCYQTNFFEVERFFELNDPMVLAQAESEQLKLLKEIQIPCLESNSVEYNIPTSVATEEYESIIENYLRLMNDGLCDP